MHYQNIDRYYDQFNPSALLEIIDRQQFGVEYQPIVDVLTGEIAGYEALARFYHADGALVPTLQMFCTLHESPLMLAQVELNLKRLQLRHRPGESPLFINIDPHALDVLGETKHGNSLVEMLSGHTDLIVEIIENTDVNDARISTSLSNIMREMGFEIALDDVGAPDTMISLDILSEVNYIKLDRAWLSREISSSRLQLLRSLISFAHSSGKKAILEGVESAEDLALGAKLGVDYVQGFFYKELFKEVRC